MKISYRWIKEFVDISETPLQLGARFTNLGMAVDALDAHGQDFLFELDIATNRPDCLSHYGVAREVAAAYGSPLKAPAFELREDKKHASEVFSISIADADLCARYCGRYIAGVKIGPSPDWLKARLEALGVRSINNVADITNYVMLELGQPLHAFDADTLEGQQIIVRRAELDEKLTTLDGIERGLNPSMLVIADVNRAVALAGVMGGAETEISDTTTNVLLESANFEPLSIRKTSRSLGLLSEASYRFERGADVEMALYACDRAAALIQELAGGAIYRGAIDVYPKRRTPVTARLRRQRIKSVLGAPVDDAEVNRIFEHLGFRIAFSNDSWSVEVPSHRLDITGEEDLIEEIARHYGFDKFPATLPKWAGHGSGLPLESKERLLRNNLSASGYSEIIPMAFSSEIAERKFRPNVNPVRLINPMAEDEAILRTSLVPGMLRTIQWNANRGTRDVQLYEIGKIYRQGGESRSLIIAATGSLRAKSVHETPRDFNFYDLKGDVEDILNVFNVDIHPNTDPLPAYYHPGRAMRIGDLTMFGELHPDYANEYKLRHRIYIAELVVDGIMAFERLRPIGAVPKFPSIRRDFSLLLNKDVLYSDIERSVQSVNIPELVRAEPFDRLESGPFPESKYALAVSLTYQSADRTLTDEEVANFDRRIMDSLRERLGAELRQ
jgi:phenylalanyl-tRNA synthetase beta chain